MKLFRALTAKAVEVMNNTEYNKINILWNSTSSRSLCALQNLRCQFCFNERGDTGCGNAVWNILNLLLTRMSTKGDETTEITNKDRHPLVRIIVRTHRLDGFSECIIAYEYHCFACLCAGTDNKNRLGT